MNKIYFRHTFICPGCENYNYRVTDRPNPKIAYQHIECGSCGEQISMLTHHATDVCLPPVFDTELLCASIILGAIIIRCKKDDVVEHLAKDAVMAFRELIDQLEESKQ